MSFIRVVLCGVLMASAIFSFVVSLYTFVKHERYFAIFSLTMVFYALGYAMEIYSGTLSRMMFWNYVQYIGLPFLPALWILFSLEYTNRHVNLLTKISLFLIPVLTLILRYTSSLNHLFYLNVQLSTNGYFPVLYIEKGPWYWVQTIFVTGCFFVSNFLYVGLYRSATGVFRRQSLLMLVASVLPWLSVILNLFNAAPLDIDLGAFALTSSLLLLFIAFLRYQFLNIKPLARDKVFELTDDAIIVLDTDLVIIDFNRSAVAIFPALTDHAVGKKLQSVLGNDSPLLRLVGPDSKTQLDLTENEENYKVNMVKIDEQDGRHLGFIVTLTNITKYVDMMKELDHLASRDPLTGVYNRRYFVGLSSNQIERAKQQGSPLSMLILDLDYFKRINDNNGHQAGDAVLRTIAGVCRSSVRSQDILGRYGGEEFVICFPGTTLEECREISGRLLENIASSATRFESSLIHTTASIGITGVGLVTDESLDYFLKYADKALYLAKSEGRNCVRSVAAPLLSQAN